MQFTKKQMDTAKNYLFEYGRPLECALFNYHFENGPAERVMDELTKFQNNDGGFGNALEPDIRASVSTGIATTIGFQIFREIGASAREESVQRAMRYLDGIYDTRRKCWPIINEAVNDAPHAEWWHYGEGRPYPMADERGNPRPEIVGYLFDYPTLTDAELCNVLLEDAIDYLSTLSDPIDMHNLLCYARLLETQKLPTPARESLLSRLLPASIHTVITDPEQWTGYGLRPLHLCNTPDSPFAPQFKGAIESNLDYEIHHQNDDGSWTPYWAWAGDAWENAKCELEGKLILQNLLAFRAYGRLTV